MRTIWEGRLDGTFHGYKFGRVYHLADGSRWRLVGETDEPVYRENPTARLPHKKDMGLTFLDVEGTSAIVEVARDGHQPKPSVGAL